MKAYNLEQRQEIDLIPGEWYAWETVPPPPGIGEIQCRRWDETFSVSTYQMLLAWNVHGVWWQAPGRSETASAEP
jgi:hypothetical protein